MINISFLGILRIFNAVSLPLQLIDLREKPFEVYVQIMCK